MKTPWGPDGKRWERIPNPTLPPLFVSPAELHSMVQKIKKDSWQVLLTCLSSGNYKKTENTINTGVKDLGKNLAQLLTLCD